MPIYKKKWFCENSVPGKRFKKVKHCFFIDKLIFKGKTKFQSVLIFENSTYGRVFCLDDIVQFSERDEFIYHEMIVHPVFFSHKNPKKVLIIGGGDGGALREVLKHSVKEVDLVELDKEIINIAKRYLKFVCRDSFSDKRVKIYNLSGEEFIEKTKNIYDVIIVDATNFGEKNSFPLYLPSFYRMVCKILKKDGIIITLGASFLDIQYIKKIKSNIKKIFKKTAIYKFCMPSYHCGEYCFIAGSKNINLKKPDFKKIKEKFDKISKENKFKYYSPEIHKTSLICSV